MWIKSDHMATLVSVYTSNVQRIVKVKSRLSAWMCLACECRTVAIVDDKSGIVVPLGISSSYPRPKCPPNKAE